MALTRDSSPRLVFHVYNVAIIHTYLAYTAFLSALCIGCLLHYKKIVKNDVAGWPEEWFPSVSATIGDWYPERNIFQILIALTSGPRFALVFLQYFITCSRSSSIPTVVFVSGIIRTLSCGGWVYITSSDDHDAHDVLMVTYIVCNIPWMIGGILCTPIRNVKAKRRRWLVASAFFVSIVPMVYFFIRHKVHRIPGAYTHYSFFEWALIFFDIMYDSIAELDFRQADLQISIGSSLQKPGDSDKILYPNTTSAEAIQIETEPAEKSSETGVVSDSIRKIYMHISVGRRPAVYFVSDVYLSYVFWSIFTSLLPTMFYFSVWELGIAGHELSLLSTLSPILLSIGPVLDWARSRSGQTVLYLTSFSGLAAYRLDHPLHRLLVVAPATSALLVQQVAVWSSMEGNKAVNQGILMGLGLVMSSLSKHANHGNNPIWPFIDASSGGYNKTGLFLALLALYNRSRPFVLAGKKKSISKGGSWLPAAIALGSLMFSLHSLLSDSSTLIAWSWTGYTNGQPNGPLPHVHGSLTLVTQCLGLLLPLVLLSWTPLGINAFAHPLWFIYGAGSSLVMYRYRNWAGYVGGLNLSVYLMSIIPLIFGRAAMTGSAGKTYFTAFLTTCILYLANVWTVAYAFVPGGIYLRERTDLVLIAQMAALSLITIWPKSGRMTLSATLPPSIWSYSRTLLALFSISSLLVALYRTPSQSPAPFNPGPRIIRAGIWTIHFGIDNEGHDSQRLVRDLIRDMQLDVVGLLETDLHRVVYGNRDLTRVVAEEMGYYIDLGPGPNSHTWGAVLLSKFPIINSTHHLLPSPDGELAPAISAVLNVYGTYVTVVVAHNGQEETPLDRELQSIELARIMSDAYPAPTLFLGYVVTTPRAERPAPYEILVTDGRMHDIDSHDFDRWCEYILYRGLYRTAYARVSRGIVTDTELQLGQWVVPRHGFGITNDTEEGRYLRSFKEQLPEEHWFPMEYYGDEHQGGHNGHFYHVFYTPLYYQIPEGAVL